MIVPLSPSQEMNYNYSFLILKNLSMFVCTLFSFLKVVEKYLGRVTKFRRAHWIGYYLLEQNNSV